MSSANHRATFVKSAFWMLTHSIKVGYSARVTLYASCVIGFVVMCLFCTPVHAEQKQIQTESQENILSKLLGERLKGLGKGAEALLGEIGKIEEVDEQQPGVSDGEQTEFSITRDKPKRAQEKQAVLEEVRFNMRTADAYREQAYRLIERSERAKSPAIKRIYLKDAQEKVIASENWFERSAESVTTLTGQASSGMAGHSANRSFGGLPEFVSGAFNRLKEIAGTKTSTQDGGVVLPGTELFDSSVMQDYPDASSKPHQDNTLKGKFKKSSASNKTDAADSSIAHLLDNMQEVQTLEKDKERLAGYLPLGQRAQVNAIHRVHRGANGEILGVAYAKITPFGISVNGQANSAADIETLVIEGTGKFLGEGAPKYPIDLDQNGKLPPKSAWSDLYLKFNAWEREIRKWEEKTGHLPRIDRNWLRQQIAHLKKIRVATGKSTHANAKWAAGILGYLDPEASKDDPSLRPGGILLSSGKVALLAGQLSIKRVSLDRGKGILIVEGDRTKHGIDLDLLSTALRLVFEGVYDPYFSLELETPWDRDYKERETKFENWVSEKLSGSKELRQKMIREGIRFTTFSGKDYYAIDAKNLDTEIGQRAAKDVRTAKKLEIRPDWLMQTRMGEILFRADALLKSHPFDGYTGQASPHLKITGVPGLPVFTDFEGLPGVEIINGRETRPNHSDRLWFMPSGTASGNSTELNLSDIHPVAKVIAQEFQNDTSGHVDEGIQEYFEYINQNFDQFAEVVPWWGQLREIYRAYVLATWLKREVPQVAHLLLETLPPPQKPSQILPELYEPIKVILVNACFLEERCRNRGNAWVYAIADDGGISFDSKKNLFSKTGAAAMQPDSNSGLTMRIALPGLTKILPGGEELWLAGDTSMNAPTEEGYKQFAEMLIKTRGVVLALLSAHFGFWSTVGLAFGGLLGFLLFFGMHGALLEDWLKVSFNVKPFDPDHDDPLVIGKAGVLGLLTDWLSYVLIVALIVMGLHWSDFYFGIQSYMWLVLFGLATSPFLTGWENDASFIFRPILTFCALAAACTVAYFGFTMEPWVIWDTGFHFFGGSFVFQLSPLYGLHATGAKLFIAFLTFMLITEILCVFGLSGVQNFMNARISLALTVCAYLYFFSGGIESAVGAWTLQPFDVSAFLGLPASVLTNDQFYMLIATATDLPISSASSSRDGVLGLIIVLNIIGILFSLISRPDKPALQAKVKLAGPKGHLP